MTITEAAVEYASLGWSVLPVKPQEKRPLMQNWTQYIRSKASVGMLQSWFDNLSGAGVGMVTGRISNIVVIDVESTCPESIESILRRYPTQLVSRTGSGGYHLYYQYPANVGTISNRVGLFEGVDLRADGGFIVLPPTIHPSGGVYQWVSRGIPGMFPAVLLDIQSSASTVYGNNDRWITEVLRGVGEGQRNDACARLCGYFFKKGLTADVVESLILEWNERNNPPMPVSEVRTTVRSIERKHADQSVGFTSVEFVDDTRTVKSSSPPPNTFELLRLKDYISGYGDEGATWLINDWLPDKSVVFLVAPPESYKTWLLMDLVTSVAMGTPFLGQFPVNNKGPAIIIQQEDSHGGLTERISLMLNEKMGNMIVFNPDGYQFPVEPDPPIYVHPSRMLRFDNPEVIRELEEQIKIIRPRIVVIDPLYSTTSVDNYMAQSAEQMMVLKSWRDKYGCTFVLAHHSRKNVDPDSTAREDSWGSQFLNAFLEAGWQIRRSSKLRDNEIVIRRHSKTMGNQSPIVLAFDISTVYPFRYSVSVTPYTASSGGAGGRPAPAQGGICGMLSSGPLSQADIAQQTGKSRSVVSRQIKQLENTGSIEKMPDGRYKLTLPTE